MDDQQRSLFLDISSHFSPPPGVKLSYGTAGFRADASLLESTVYRVGILAALRALKTGSVTGLMITASHNMISDNGVKVADPNGGMLTQDWEPFAESLANAPDSNTLVEMIEAFAKKENIMLDGTRIAEVYLGRDTRPSGASLLEAAKQGVTSIARATATDMGILTTPQLHWLVREKNKKMIASELSYYNKVTSSFRSLLELAPQEHRTISADDKLVVDGADGVGGEKLEHFKTSFIDIYMEVRNSGNGVLNDGVGADFVQKEKVVPRGFGSADTGLRCASLDGDADRLVYFFVEPNSTRIQLVDGDKIMALFALFIQEQLSILNRTEGSTVSRPHEARVGIVQTAYANGASTQYLKQLGLEVVFTPTGVKHLHEKAAEYDIGIYFEANGHGTILFTDTYITRLNDDLFYTPRDSEKGKAGSRLLAVSKLANQAVGDALAGLLLVEAILKHFGWSIHRWNKLYHDLPSRQLKVKVADRSAVITANAETVVVNPPDIQKLIDVEVANFKQGRCFIRPSGTEDVVRVYAEASTQESADALASSVAKLVENILGCEDS